MNIDDFMKSARVIPLPKKVFAIRGVVREHMGEDVAVSNKGGEYHMGKLTHVNGDSFSVGSFVVGYADVNEFYVRG